MLAYDFEEVRDFYSGRVFRMSEHTGAVILETGDISIPAVNENFRYGKFILYCHAVTPRYVIGTFTTAD